MLIDTHCHLDAPEFDADRVQVIAAATAAGVAGIVIPAVARTNFDAVRDLAHTLPLGAYALGIHPIAVPQAREEDLADLDARISRALRPRARNKSFMSARRDQTLLAAAHDARLVAIGEIGLDFFVPALTSPAMRARQEFFYTAQLDMAQRHSLPVILHLRRSQDALLKHLRRSAPIGGIAHAFNGSVQQAQQFIALGFALGFGGAMTYPRALQIRRLAAQLPLTALVLETDAPDIPPAWLSAPGARAPRNTPAQLARIVQELAQLRGVDVDTLAAACTRNAQRVLPRLGMLSSIVRGDPSSVP